MRSISLLQNPIKKIYIGGFIGLSNVLLLSPRGIGIQELEDMTFKGLHNVQNLDLSRNNVTFLGCPVWPSEACLIMIICLFPTIAMIFVKLCFAMKGFAVP